MRFFVGKRGNKEKMGFSLMAKDLQTQEPRRPGFGQPRDSQQGSGSQTLVEVG